MSIQIGILIKTVRSTNKLAEQQPHDKILHPVVQDTHGIE